LIARPILMRALLSTFVLPGLMAGLFASGLQAQDAGDETSNGPSRFGGGADFWIAQPLGDFRTYVDGGFGGGGHLRFLLDERGYLSLQAEAGMIRYGSETTRFQVSTRGGSFYYRMTTANDAWLVSLSPRVTVPVGRLRPYASAGMGLANFVTATSVQQDTTGATSTSRTHLRDLKAGPVVGAGIAFLLGAGSGAPALQMGMVYHRNGQARYLREGDVRDAPDGDVQFTPIVSATDLISWRMGFSFGAWGGGRR